MRSSERAGSGRKMVMSLVTMAAADGRIGRRERVLIEGFCRTWGVDPGVLEESIEAARSGKRRLHLPKTEAERHTLLEALLAVAAVDRVIDEGERKCLRLFADRLGISSDDQDRLLERALREREGSRERALREREGRELRERALEGFEIAMTAANERSRPTPDTNTCDDERDPFGQESPRSRRPFVAAGVALALCLLTPLATGAFAGSNWVAKEEVASKRESVPTAEDVAKSKREVQLQTKGIQEAAALVQEQIAKAREERRHTEGAKGRLAQLEAARSRDTSEQRQRGGF